MSTNITSRKACSCLEDVILAINDMSDIPLRRRQDLTSGCKTVARALGLPTSQIKADPAWLKEQLKLLPRTPAGMTNGHWRNTRSRLGSALAIAGTVSMSKRSREPITPAWDALIAALPDRYWRSNLSRLARFCSQANINPDAVNDATISDFAAMLAASMVERPNSICRTNCVAWNRAVASRFPWPATKLTEPNNRRHYSLPLKALPRFFVADVDAFLAQAAGDDVFSESARRPASPITLRNRRLQIRQIASVMVLAGRELSTLQSLRDLVDVAWAKRAMTFLHERNGQRKTGSLHNMMMLLVQIGRYWVKLPDAEIDALKLMRKKLDPGKSRMTSRNTARLRVFDDQINVDLLAHAPRDILKRLSQEAPPTFSDAIKVQSALAIGILFNAPMRAKNLASLRIDKHLIRTRLAIDATMYLVIPADEVKNGVDLEFALSPALGGLLNLYIERYRPLLSTDAFGFLFPARSGGAKTPAHLATQILNAVRATTGLTVNAHLFRHLSAKIFLRAFPGEYETVRQLLGHKDLNTTLRAYCEFKPGDAVRRYDALLQSFDAAKAAP